MLPNIELTLPCSEFTLPSLELRLPCSELALPSPEFMLPTLEFALQCSEFVLQKKNFYKMFKISQLTIFRSIYNTINEVKTQKHITPNQNIQFLNLRQENFRHHATRTSAA